MSNLRLIILINVTGGNIVRYAISTDVCTMPQCSYSTYSVYPSLVQVSQCDVPQSPGMSLSTSAKQHHVRAVSKLVEHGGVVALPAIGDGGGAQQVAILATE